MPLLNAELFADGLMARPALVDNMNYLLMGHYRYDDQGRRLPLVPNTTQARFRAKPNREDALLLLQELRGAIVDQGRTMGKGLRPWDINLAVFNNLDKNQAWWGFEFETGWASSDAMKQGKAHSWDNYDGVTYDEEGEGHNAVEITFIPANQSEFADKTAPAYKFTKWMSDNRALTYNGGNNNIGCHWNVSSPGIRASLRDAEKVTHFLNRTLRNLRAVNGQRAHLFGRERLYGGFYLQSSNNGQNIWLEMKGFRTTYDIEQFDNYMAACTAMQKCIDYFFAHKEECIRDLLACTNLYDVAFNGAEVRVAAGQLPAAPGAQELLTRGYAGFYVE